MTKKTWFVDRDDGLHYFLLDPNNAYHDDYATIKLDKKQRIAYLKVCKEFYKWQEKLDKAYEIYGKKKGWFSYSI